jgi:hypothetical protein
MSRWIVEALAEDPNELPARAVDEVEEMARAKRCVCGKLIGYLRALHGRRHCSARCAHGRRQ